MGYNKFMRKIKNLKIIIIAILVIAVLACGVLVADKKGLFEEETTTEPITLATTKITFIEGITLTECFELLEQNGVASYDALMNTAQNYAFTDYKIYSDIPADESRCFKLEGYLFPDTYDFFLDEAPESVISRFLSNADVKITDDMRARANELGYTMDEIMIIASIIQAEGAFQSDAATIAGIIYNRLEDNMRLEMDSTYFYVTEDIASFVGEENIEGYKEIYNTYDCFSLPQGPVCNPGMFAINAALYPEETDYYYFCHDKEGNTYYAKTYSEHLRNCDKAGL
ncbi:MAG: endolytic transglycosylase MltG [Ruminococcaceae bacterium]|nr:endolytic transglycosylase MltG [Oscillospiraceae bacterium]